MSQTVDDGVGDMAVRRGPNTVLRLVERWSLAAAGLLAWQWLTVEADNRYFPTPLAILRAAGRLWFSGPPSRLGLNGQVVDDVLPGLARAAAGWGVAAVVGVGLGVALGRCGLSGRSLLAGRRLVKIARLAVPLAVPVLFVFVQVGGLLEILGIAAGAVWPVLIGAAIGARTVDPTTVETAMAYRIPWYRLMYGVIIPAALPDILAGLRTALLTALPLMAVAELVGPGGVGHRMIAAPVNADLPGVWAWLALVGVVGAVAARLLTAAERRTRCWFND